MLTLVIEAGGISASPSPAQAIWQGPEDLPATPPGFCWVSYPGLSKKEVTQRNPPLPRSSLGTLLLSVLCCAADQALHPTPIVL